VVTTLDSNTRRDPLRDLSTRRRTRYVWCLVAMVAMLLGAVGAASTAAGAPRWAPLLMLVALPVVVRVSDTVSQLLLMTLVRPTPPLPRLAGTKLAPALAVTAVVYPVIVDGPADVDALLACIRDNRDVTGRGPAMHLALVDLADSEHERDDSDEALCHAIRAGLAGMGGGPAPVAALFRRRLWNPREGRYLGWERKRGKLEELVALLDGRDDTSFVLATAADRALVDRLRTVRYLLTIDLGDQLLPRATRRLVATIAHPDNVAVVAPDRRLVVAGFGFVRPIHVPAQPRTWFEWATYPYRQPEGIPSTKQAAFGYDDFFGQGVIDIAAYRAVLAGRIPPDRVLSHDRLEGLHARTAAVTDARLVEAPVGDYLHFRARQHRWVRGDTHLLPWILGRAGLARLPVVERLGMARDLLTHLYPAGLTGLLAGAWLGAPVGQVGWWTLAILAVSAHPIAVTSLLPQLAALRVAGPGGPGRWRRLAAAWRRSLPSVTRLARAETARWLISLTMLVDLALVSMDAVARAGYRMWVSHRRVLQWTSSSRQGRLDPGLGPRIRRLWPASLFAAGLAAAVTAVDPVRLLAAGPLLLAWLAIPVLAYWLSRPANRLPDVSMV
jgi:cyclic beta-1,2-glucan glucanotransferase